MQIAFVLVLGEVPDLLGLCEGDTWVDWCNLLGCDGTSFLEMR